MIRKLKYSIIISSYNVEKYIVEAILSVSEQVTNSDKEIILVDDHSSDKTLDLAKKINVSNLKIIELSKNAGLSNSRNIGLKHATGDWILFLDGDDCYDPGLLQYLDSRIRDHSDVDLFIFGFSKMTSLMERKVYSFIPHNNLNGIYTGAWNKAYARSTIKDLQFPVGKYYEDMSFTAIAYFRSKKPEVIKESFINYRERDGSITQLKEVRKHFDVVDVLQELIYFRNNNELAIDQIKDINRLVNKQFFVHAFEANKVKKSKREFELLVNSFHNFQIKWGTGNSYDSSLIKNIKDFLLMVFYRIK